MIDIYTFSQSHHSETAEPIIRQQSVSIWTGILLQEITVWCEHSAATSPQRLSFLEWSEFLIVRFYMTVDHSFLVCR